jgi:PAS domain S-box-containing protein
MLADALGVVREALLAEVERAAEVAAAPGWSDGGRRERLSALLDELIEALRRGRIDYVPAPASLRERDLDGSEREILRRRVIGRIASAELAASTDEIVLVAEWGCGIDAWRMREQNRQLRALLASIEASTAVIAPDGRILYVNERCARFLRDASGIEPEDLVGRTLEELAIPAEFGLGQVEADIRSLGRSRDSYETVVGGRTRQTRVNAIYAPDGTTTAVGVVMRDIHAETLSRHRLAMLSRLGALVGTLEYDDAAEALAHVPIPELADWCMVNIVENRRIEKSFLAHRDPGRSGLRDEFMNLLPGPDRHPLWQNMLIGGYQLLSEVTDDMVRRLALDQEHAEVLSKLEIRSLLVMPVVSRGQLAGIITLAYTTESGRRYGRDDPALTEELAVHAGNLIEAARLTKALRASEARFRIALAAARTNVFEQDRTLTYTYYYNAATRFDPVGTKDGAIYPPEQATHVSRLKEHVLATGESVFEEGDFGVADGPVRHYRGAIEPVRDHTGRIVGIIGAGTDITEQYQARQQLTEMVALRDRMAGMLGHDLRNPLTTVRMGVDMLLDRPNMPADAHDPLVRIGHAAQRMQEMIDTILDFARARALGSIPISRVSIHLDELAQGVVDEARIAWPRRAIELEIHGDRHVIWDPARMAQVISNLLANALSYGDANAPVRLSIDGSADPVVIAVHNEGPPIAPDTLSVMFEPFRRGAEDRSQHGLGLGLYIVEQLVRAHDGTIDVQSTAAGGTTFTLCVPRAHAAATAGATVH